LHGTIPLLFPLEARLARRRRGFGRIEKRPSGRYRVAYTGPDTRLYKAPSTFPSRVDAEGWLAQVKREIDLGIWEPPTVRRAKQAVEAAKVTTTFQAYAAMWLSQRTLKPRTRDHYQALLDNQLLPAFGDLPGAAITPFAIKDWHTAMGTGTPTLRTHAYGLLRTILGEAVHDGLIPANPCHIRGPGTTNGCTSSSPPASPSWRPSWRPCRSGTG
jgi:hypothetical protein